MYIAQARDRRDWLVMAGLLILAVVTRLPFTEHVFYHWDSINFAYSLQRFDIAASQPQIPGYILFVYLARFVNWITGDPQTTLVSLSIAGGALATVALYLLGREMYSRKVGLIAALFLASSPLFWFYGEIALPHTLDAFMVTISVWMLYRISKGDNRLLIPLALWLAVAGGLRQQTEVFVAPLALYAIWRGRPWQTAGWRHTLSAFGILVFANLLWLIPLLALSGGVAGYLATMRAYTAYFDTTTSIFSGGGLFGLTRNVIKLSMYSAYGWALPFIPGAVGAVEWLSQSLPLPGWVARTIHDNRLWFFILWIGPTMGYYLFVHMGQQGLVFVYLPALLLLSARGAVHLGWERNTMGRLALTGVLLVNSAIFLAAPVYPLGGATIKLLTVDTLRQHDAYYLDRFAAIQQEFSPRSTLIISSEWRFPQYYLPNYHYVPYYIVQKWEDGEGTPQENQDQMVNPAAMGLHPNRHGMYTLVLIDDDLKPFYQSSDQVSYVHFPDGSQMATIQFDSQDRLYLSPSDFRIVHATASK
jgi:hypothetical protein